MVTMQMADGVAIGLAVIGVMLEAECQRRARMIGVLLICAAIVVVCAGAVFIPYQPVHVELVTSGTP